MKLKLEILAKTDNQSRRDDMIVDIERETINQPRRGEIAIQLKVKSVALSLSKC